MATASLQLVHLSTTPPAWQWTERVIFLLRTMPTSASVGVSAATGNITTVAGVGTADFSGDGAATSVTLYNPQRVTLHNNDIIIADTSSSRIRRVSAATGIISTVAGRTMHGFGGDGGPATAAYLSSPIGVAVDRAGNIIVADCANHRIRRVSAATGIMTTLAGNGYTGFDGDGRAATSSSVHYPYGVTTDIQSNIFIADTHNSRIRRVSAATGIITTVAGNGVAGFSGEGVAATSASLYHPTGLVLDGSGNIFVADFGNSRIRRVSAATGIITSVAGNGFRGFSGEGGPATSAMLYYPYTVALDEAGRLFIADGGNNRVRMVALTAPPGVSSTVTSSASVIGSQTGSRSGTGSPTPPATVTGTPSASTSYVPPSATATPFRCITNSFEGGRLDPFVADARQPGLVAVVSSTQELYYADDYAGNYAASVTPLTGAYMARLVSPRVIGEYTSLSLTVVAPIGARMSFDVLFDAGDLMPYNDDGSVLATVQLAPSASADARELLSLSVADVGDMGKSGWIHGDAVLAGAGNYTLTFRVRSRYDDVLPSALYVDNAQVCVLSDLSGASSLPTPTRTVGLASAFPTPKTTQTRTRSAWPTPFPTRTSSGTRTAAQTPLSQSPSGTALPSSAPSYRPSCPAGWVSPGSTSNQCFALARFDTAVSAAVARSTCQAMGGDLAWPLNAADSEYMVRGRCGERTNVSASTAWTGVAIDTRGLVVGIDGLYPRDGYLWSAPFQSYWVPGEWPAQSPSSYSLAWVAARASSDAAIYRARVGSAASASAACCSFSTRAWTYTDEWGPCSCDQGTGLFVEHRLTACYGWHDCAGPRPPPQTRSCSGYEPSYYWQAGSWSQCTLNVGAGSQVDGCYPSRGTWTRNLTCLSYDGCVGRVVSASLCDASSAPASTAACSPGTQDGGLCCFPPCEEGSAQSYAPASCSPRPVAPAPASPGGASLHTVDTCGPVVLSPSRVSLLGSLLTIRFDGTGPQCSPLPVGAEALCRFGSGGANQTYITAAVLSDADGLAWRCDSPFVDAVASIPLSSRWMAGYLGLPWGL